MDLFHKQEEEEEALQLWELIKEVPCSLCGIVSRCRLQGDEETLLCPACDEESPPPEGQLVCPECGFERPLADSSQPGEHRLCDLCVCLISHIDSGTCTECTKTDDGSYGVNCPHGMRLLRTILQRAQNQESETRRTKVTL